MGKTQKKDEKKRFDEKVKEDWKIKDEKMILSDCDDFWAAASAGTSLV